MSEPQTLHWFHNDGGPLLVVPGSAAAVWEGGDPPSGGRVVEASFRYGDQLVATDYDRACDVSGWAEVLQIGSSWGVVLGDTTSGSAAWLKPGDGDSFYLVGLGFADHDDPVTLLTLAEEVCGGEWIRLLDRATVGPDGLLLLHAASRPEEIRERSFDAAEFSVIGDGIRYPAAAGSYILDSCTQQTEEAEVTFVRFRRVEP